MLGKIPKKSCNLFETNLIILKGDKQFILATSMDPLTILKKLSTSLTSGQARAREQAADARERKNEQATPIKGRAHPQLVQDVLPLPGEARLDELLKPRRSLRRGRQWPLADGDAVNYW